MTELIFQILNSVGFNHPLHPAMTHVPMGMIMGGFVFGIVSFFLRKPELARTAYHCFVLALIGILPTMLLGYMDWQHTYEGEWSTPVVLKMILAVSLGVLLVFAVKLGRKTEPVSAKVMVIYALCLINTIGLGFLGGELQYG